MTSTKLKQPLIPREPEPDDPMFNLSYADVEQIGTALKKYIGDREGLLAAVNAVATINVNGICITLEPRLLERMKTRCINKERWPEFLAEIVTRQLHDWAGW
jgi:hypothetical protein